jgi:hypothetical protein
MTREDKEFLKDELLDLLELLDRAQSFEMYRIVTAAYGLDDETDYAISSIREDLNSLTEKIRNLLDILDRKGEEDGKAIPTESKNT